MTSTPPYCSLSVSHPRGDGEQISPERILVRYSASESGRHAGVSYTERTIERYGPFERVGRTETFVRRERL